MLARITRIARIGRIASCECPISQDRVLNASSNPHQLAYLAGRLLLDSEDLPFPDVLDGRECPDQVGRMGDAPWLLVFQASRA